MPLEYYPLNRILENQYTRGNEYLLPNGTPYSGRYYRTFNGKAYTGINPVLGTNIVLTPIASANTQKEASLLVPGRAVASGRDAKVVKPYADARVQNGQDDTLALTELTIYYPIVTDEDYARGYFTRYFAKTVSGPGYVFEISKLDWTKVQNGNVDDTILGYETVQMLWQLVGPLKDTRTSQYAVQGGVYDTNKRVTENTAKRFNGLLAYIGGDYTKYAKITPEKLTT